MAPSSLHNGMQNSPGFCLSLLSMRGNYQLLIPPNTLVALINLTFNLHFNIGRISNDLSFVHHISWKPNCQMMLTPFLLPTIITTLLQRRNLRLFCLLDLESPNFEVAWLQICLPSMTTFNIHHMEWLISFLTDGVGLKPICFPFLMI